MGRAKSYNTTGKSIQRFQIRWNEALGHNECPYAYRWVLVTPIGSIRIHKFLRSDDKRYFHDHSWDFWTFIIKGSYYDVSPDKNNTDYNTDTNIIKKLHNTFHLYKIKAEHKHFVEVNEGPCWTIVFSTNKKRNWGFWVNGIFKRPLKYFYRYGHPPCEEV